MITHRPGQIEQCWSSTSTRVPRTADDPQNEVKEANSAVGRNLISIEHGPAINSPVRLVVVH
jgi:hypothetical protein